MNLETLFLGIGIGLAYCGLVFLIELLNQYVFNKTCHTAPLPLTILFPYFVLLVALCFLPSRLREGKVGQNEVNQSFEDRIYKAYVRINKIDSRFCDMERSLTAHFQKHLQSDLTIAELQKKLNKKRTKK